MKKNFASTSKRLHRKSFLPTAFVLLDGKIIHYPTHSWCHAVQHCISHTDEIKGPCATAVVVIHEIRVSTICTSACLTSRKIILSHHGALMRRQKLRPFHLTIHDGYFSLEVLLDHLPDPSMVMDGVASLSCIP